MSDRTLHSDDKHAWVRARLAALASGLLDDETATTVRSHLDGCEECRGAFEALTASRNEPGETRLGEHIPSGLLATWDRTTLELRGLERRMIRRHLESCQECQADLTLLGFAPELSEMPAPAVRLDPATAGASLAPAPSQPRGRVIRPRSWFEPWQRWAYGGGGALAAAALAVLLRTINLGGPTPQMAGRPGESPPVHAVPSPDESPPSARPDGGTLPNAAGPDHSAPPSIPSSSTPPPRVDAPPVRVEATLLASTRGMPVTLPELPVVEIPRAADRLAVQGLRIVTESGKDASVVIAMFGPRGQEMAREQTTLGRLRSTSEITFPMPGFSAGLPFEDFVIVLAVTPGDGSEPDSARYVIRLASPAR